MIVFLTRGKSDPRSRGRRDGDGKLRRAYPGIRRIGFNLMLSVD